MAHPASVDLYERDFYTWTQDQAARLRALSGDNRVDAAHLAEEIADLGRSELNKTRQHLLQLLIHLLKCGGNPAGEPRGHWLAEAANHARQAQAAFSPGMRQHLDLHRLWRDALADANRMRADDGETALPADLGCPFTLDALLDPAVTPETLLGRIQAALGET